MQIVQTDTHIKYFFLLILMKLTKESTYLGSNARSSLSILIFFSIGFRRVLSVLVIFIWLCCPRIYIYRQNVKVLKFKLSYSFVWGSFFVDKCYRNQKLQFLGTKNANFLLICLKCFLSFGIRN